MRVNAETLYRGWVGMGEWVRVVGGWVAGCYGVRRFTIILTIAVTVKRCASANKPCMVGGWVQVGGC